MKWLHFLIINKSAEGQNELLLPNVTHSMHISHAS